jgi:xanthine dehydrogenase YagR molybdenum-binding subunit
VSSIGKAFDRVDARKKVTGTATYAAEVEITNVAHAVILGSAIAKGSISAIDRTAAEQAPGVLLVLTHDNAPRFPGATAKPSGTDKVVQLLQDATIYYADQPIALVVADTLERAQHAAALLEVTYTPGTPPIADILDASHAIPARADAYKPDKAGPRGTPDSARGDFDTAFAAAPIKIDQTYTTPVETHNPMEMHATIAAWQGNDHLTLYDATQGIFSARSRIAAVFGLAKENVRVINHYVGGGFGSKGSAWSHVGLAAMAAKVAARPVKLMVTRIQMQSLVGHRPVTHQRVALACDAKGKLLATKHEVTSETSRFDEFVEPSALQTRMLYSCPNVVTSHRIVRVDVPTPTFTRAPGEASGTYAIESAMDELAYAAKIDPLQLRIVNHATQDEDEKKPFSSKSLLACYSKAAERFGWAKRAKSPRSMRDGRWLVGQGMATATYPARQMPASAIAKLRPDGTFLVQAGTQDIGTGTYTIMTQIAADALGVPFEAITFELGDTVYPETPLSGGSFTAASTGSAVKMTGLELRKQMIEMASLDAKSPLYGAKLDEVDVADGAMFVKSSPGKRETYKDLIARSGKPEISATFKTEKNKNADKFSMHSFGATFAEVRVDEDLGIIRVSRFVGAYSAGTILNPKTARSQFLGGIVWGISMALHEVSERDSRTARNMSRDLADYHVAVNADIPDIDVIMIDEVDPYVNELGVKGIGEIGITGANAAVANAVFHATGKRVRDLPIRLDDLLEDVRA